MILEGNGQTRTVDYLMLGFFGRKTKYAFNSDTIHPDSGIFEPSRMKPVQILKPRLSWRRYRAITSCGVRFTFSLNYVIITS